MSVYAISRYVASGLVMLGLAACAAPAQEGVHGGRGMAQTGSDSLAQTSWDLLTWTRPDGQQRAVPSAGGTGQPINISFTYRPGEPSMTGFSGCNRFMGQYVMNNGLLVVPSQPASTSMACPSSDTMLLEFDFLTALTHIAASRLDNANNPQQLVLTLHAGDVLEFKRRADPLAGQQGVTKFVYVNSQRVPCSAGAGRGMCYQVRDSAEQPWQFWYGEIEGFHFEPGVEYRLRIVEVNVKNPPADASSVRWVLDMVVEQKVVGR